jgi:phosphatidylcholine synthase
MLMRDAHAAGRLPMSHRFLATLVHILTASGAGLALLALLAAAKADWRAMFLWLGIALIVDAIDGPLARRVEVATVLPRWSGERLDLIVDYLTYVAVPAFALCRSDLLPEASRIGVGVAIMLSSLVPFADRKAKTDEGYFSGFPAVWNMVCFYLFILAPPPFVSLAVVVLLIGLTFVPMLWVHPFRVRRYRSLTMLVTALWGGAALFTFTKPFPSPLWLQLILIATLVYLIGIGVVRTVTPPQAR